MIKIGELCMSKDEWINQDATELNDLQKEAVRIIRNWTNNEAVFYLTTSGSTGPPKEIALSKELLIWSANNTFKYLALRIEKIGCCLPLNKAGGFMMLIRSLIYECDIHIVEPTADPIQYLDDDCSFISLVPYQLIRILKNEESTKRLNGINKILLGGAEIPSGLNNKLNELKSSIYFGYGMTETASHIALATFNNGGFKKGFEVLPGVEIRIGVKKSINISIPQFGLHMETNDIGMIEDDRLVIKGRKDYFINSGGAKIHANQIEEIVVPILTAAKLDIAFVVIGLSHPLLGEAISLISEGKEIPTLIQSSINTKIEKSIDSKYKIVNWYKVEHFPIINHKIDKRKLKSLLNQQ
jgi:O-succinylbenzoic acid--CoA ligase